MQNIAYSILPTLHNNELFGDFLHWTLSGIALYLSMLYCNTVSHGSTALSSNVLPVLQLEERKLEYTTTRTCTVPLGGQR